MISLFGEILTCLIAALCLGVLIGWLLGQRRHRARNQNASPGGPNRAPRRSPPPGQPVEPLTQSVANYRTEIEAAAKWERAANQELKAVRERITQQERQIEGLRAQPEASSPHPERPASDENPGGLPNTAPLPPDDLTEIHGIGPKIARMLNGFGITTFRQIAEFSEADIERVAAALHGFPDRIARDHWIDDARHKYEAKYGRGPDH